MLHVPIIPIIYQNIHSFLDKYKSLPTIFHKGTLYNSEDNNVLIVIPDAYFHI